MHYITTSRKPGLRVRAFVKDIAFLFEAEYITRGKNSISDLIADARYKAVDKIVIITEKNGNPHQLLIMSVDEKNWEWEETYFIKIIKAKSEVNSEKFRIRNFIIETKNKALNSIFNKLDIDSKDSEFIIKDLKNGISIFKGKKEIGPSFDVTFAKGLND
jgi:rRNA maturation protein Rpf1